jgi:AbrB family looped-hinge helix DNA binding protein
MSLATMTSNGRITIPKDVRDSLKLAPSDRVLVTVEDGYAVLNLYVENRQIFLEALEIFSLKPVDFIDAYNAAYLKSRGLSEIYTYDRDFDAVDFLRRRDP